MGKRDVINHIAILRLSSMSSTAIAALVVAGLRRAYPALAITVVAEGRFFPFFEDIADLNMIEYDSAGKYGGLGGMFRLRQDIIDREVDAIADFHGNIYTRFLRNLFMPWQCKVSKVDNGREGKILLTRKFRKVFIQQKSTVMRYVDVLSQLGFNVMPRIPEHSAKPLPEEVMRIVGEKSGVWVGIAPFAAFNGKIYPLKYTDELIGMLCDKYDLIFLFGRGEYELQFAHAMEKRHKGVVSVMNKMNLSQELNLMSYLDVVVTMDSAPMHMASLMGVKTVSIWGATHPYVGYYGFGQLQDSMIQVDMACRPCSVNGSKRCMFGDYACMKGIKPSRVADKVDEIIHGGRSE